MKLFNNTTDLDNNKNENSLDIPWQHVDIISSNCPVHVGVRLKRLDDNTYQCPKGKEIYKAKSDVSNQSNKDRYDLSIVIK